MAEQIVPDVDCCAGCNAFEPNRSGVINGSQGYCLAHPPEVRFGAHFAQPGSGVPEASYMFPIVQADWWCREFQKIVGAP